MNGALIVNTSTRAATALRYARYVSLSVKVTDLVSSAGESVSNSENKPAGTVWSQVDNVLQRIAYKVGRDEFALSRGDFVIRYFPWRKHAYRVNKFGSVVRVYFGVFPLDPEFEFYLHRALGAVVLAVTTKGGKLEKFGSIEQTRDHLRKVAPHWYQLPKLVPMNELDVEESYKVVVKHKASGLIIVKESKRPKFSAMVIDARVELAEQVDALERLKQSEAKKEGTQ